ncbi:hypothetical protein JNO48_10665 [Clostridiales bacterium]|nr:hypothetical protein JNO48_10665 [Clostridiales bacterium]
MLNAEKLLEDQVARSLGLDKYAGIIEKMWTVNVSSDVSFQRAFNAFYRIRRNEKWRRKYYCLFEEAKEEGYTFADIIRTLYAETGNVEASFSSKMIASIDPNKPIWDQYVLQNLGFELKGKTVEERLENAVIIYRQIEQWYSDYLLTEEASHNIATFDKCLPSYTWLTEVKKIDYLLWSKR